MNALQRNGTFYTTSLDVTHALDMAKNLYKYVGSSYIDKVFSSSEHMTLKCSYPKDFNDPYELFLTIDFNERPDALAFYADTFQEIPQEPTTCFSRSPAVVPMWAHYAENLQGFAIEFDEARLAEAFPKSGFGDVDYQDKPDEDLTELLYRAYAIGKPRYMYFLQKAVFSAAYYTKSSCWSYEQERRMIVRDRETRSEAGIILMDVPCKCIKTIICGPRAKAETTRELQEKANEIGCGYLQMKIGKTQINPFFVDLQGDPFEFKEGEIARSIMHCRSCKEPLLVDAKLCSWCQIEESHRINAASRNPYRMLSNLGMLGSYLEGMEAIGRNAKKTDA